jgi:hypothetical protein
MEKINLKYLPGSYGEVVDKKCLGNSESVLVVNKLKAWEDLNYAARRGLYVKSPSQCPIIENVQPVMTAFIHIQFNHINNWLLQDVLEIMHI